jgi:hypothetical protein
MQENVTLSCRKLVEVTGLTNAEFIEQYAGPGKVGLVGGKDLISRTIRFAQRHISPDHHSSQWAHAFIYSGKRIDQKHWVMESDLDIHRHHWRLGTQENRADKYFDEVSCSKITILDFNLSKEQELAVLSSGLDLIAGMTRYSVRELVGTLLAIRKPSLRSRENLLRREGSLYCSAMVQHCFAAAGISFMPGVTLKNTTPQDIWATPVAHTAYVLVRHKQT